jgi:hypothetical protein
MRNLRFSQPRRFKSWSCGLWPRRWCRQWDPPKRRYSTAALQHGVTTQKNSVYSLHSDFLFTTASRPGLRPTQPPIQWVPGAFSLEVKRPGLEGDHSHPSSVEVKNAWSYTTTPPYIFMAWYFVKHRDNFTFNRQRCTHTHAHTRTRALNYLR